MNFMNDERLTAAQVRGLDVGTRVRVYHYDRHGELVYTVCIVVQSYKKKTLKVFSLFGYPPEYKPIAKESDRRWYTLDR